MAFGNITVVYLAGSAQASMWGTDARRVLDTTSGITLVETTITNHGTGGVVIRTVDPYTTSTTDTTEANFGWGIDNGATANDIGGASGARRYFKAGNHTAQLRIKESGTLGTTATLYFFIYRVATIAAGEGRTLLASTSTSISLPTLSAYGTFTVSLNPDEVILEAGETIQWSFELGCTGAAITGKTLTFAIGPQGGVTPNISFVGLGVLGDGVATIAASATVAGVTGKILNTAGTIAGSATVAGVAGATSSTTATVLGGAVVAGAVSAVAGTVAVVTGSAAVAGAMSSVLGTKFTIDTGAGGTAVTQIFAVLD